MKNKYSVFSLIKNALSYHENWQRAWKDPTPKKEYDAVIVGGGGHGLATAYYLAKKHNMKNIGVVEKGWIGGGNTGRNTTIIRSNYLWDASAGLYDHALKIWEGLSQELNYNVMFSQRGVMNLAHNLQDVRDLKRRTHANRLNGIDAVYLSTEEVKKFCPIINTSPDIRYPVLGGTLQRRAGTARHDAVAWGYARGADEMGVDIIQNCEVKGIKRNGDSVEGIETTKGFIKTKKIGVVAAGHSSVVANMAGLRLPLESKPLQALVSEPVKPIIDTVVMSNAVHAYVSQSDKGELVIGAGTDDYVSYTQKTISLILEGTVSGRDDIFETPISAARGSKHVLQGWTDIYNANKGTLSEELQSLEASQISKFGPRSIAVPWEERREGVLSYFGEGPKVTLSSYDAPRSVLRPLSLDKAITYMKNSTNSGLPYMVRKRRGNFRLKTGNRFKAKTKLQLLGTDAVPIACAVGPHRIG
jgi:sarcosine oxidase subunit beta